MRNLAVSIMLAVVTPIIADPEVNVVHLGFLMADTSCPAATYKLVECPYYSTAPNAYLAFEKQQKGKPNNLENSWVVVVGVEDTVTCAPTVLMRVRSIERSPVIPLCP